MPKEELGSDGHGFVAGRQPNASHPGARAKFIAGIPAGSSIGCFAVDAYQDTLGQWTVWSGRGMLVETFTPNDGRTWCAVFDADVTATNASLAAWKALTAGNAPARDQAPAAQFLQTMIYGANNELGHLIRYWCNA